MSLSPSKPAFLPDNENNTDSFGFDLEHKSSSDSIEARSAAAKLRKHSVEDQLTVNAEADKSCRNKWLRYISLYGEESLLGKSEPLSFLIYSHGVEAARRADLWMMWSGATNKRKKESTRYYNDLLLSVGEKSRVDPGYMKETLEQIELDLPRTCPRHRYFQSKSGKTALRHVLTAYSFRNPALGYLQSMNFLACFLLLNLETEEDVFWVLAAIVEDIAPKFYCQGLNGLQELMEVFSLIVQQKMKAFTKHMGNMGIDVTLRMPTWWLPLYFNALPPEVTAQVWDAYFYAFYDLGKEYAEAVICSVGFALIKSVELACLLTDDCITATTIVMEIGQDFVASSDLLKVAFNGGLMLKEMFNLIQTTRETLKQERDLANQKSLQKKEKLEKQKALKGRSTKKWLSTLFRKDSTLAVSGKGPDENLPRGKKRSDMDAKLHRRSRTQSSVEVKRNVPASPFQRERSVDSLIDFTLPTSSLPHPEDFTLFPSSPPPDSSTAVSPLPQSPLPTHSSTSLSSLSPLALRDPSSPLPATTESKSVSLLFKRPTPGASSARKERDKKHLVRTPITSPMRFQDENGVEVESDPLSSFLSPRKPSDSAKSTRSIDRSFISPYTPSSSYSPSKRKQQSLPHLPAPHLKSPRRDANQKSPQKGLVSPSHSTLPSLQRTPFFSTPGGNKDSRKAGVNQGTTHQSQVIDKENVTPNANTTDHPSSTRSPLQWTSPLESHHKHDLISTSPPPTISPYKKKREFHSPFKKKKIETPQPRNYELLKMEETSNTSSV